MKGSKAPVYVVKPKNIFKHPFNKFDLDKPSIRETQNQDLTDYFNYGFNEDTMNIYGKLVKRAIETLDESVNSTYFDEPSQLMRLNDQIPMDFGGFCKFFDNSVFVGPEGVQNNLTNMEDFHNGQELFKYFIYQILTKRPQYPLIDFVKSLYEAPDQKQGGGETSIYEIKAEIQKNLQAQYKKVMVKLQEKRNALAPPATQKSSHKSKSRDRKSKKQQQQSSGSSSGSQSQDSDSGSSQSDHKKKRKQRSRQKSKRQRKSHRESSRKSHKRRREDSRQHRRKRSKSRHRRQRDKKRDRKDRHRSKDKYRDRSQERDRDRKKRRH